MKSLSLFLSENLTCLGSFSSDFKLFFAKADFLFLAFFVTFTLSCASLYLILMLFSSNCVLSALEQQSSLSDRSATSKLSSFFTLDCSFGAEMAEWVLLLWCECECVGRGLGCSTVSSMSLQPILNLFSVVTVCFKLRNSSFVAQG